MKKIDVAWGRGQKNIGQTKNKSDRNTKRKRQQSETATKK